MVFHKNNKGGKMKEIRYEIAGVEAFVYVDSLQEIPYVYQLQRELEDFQKTFWKNEEIDWQDCIDDPTEYVILFFERCSILRPNQKVEKLIREKLEKRYKNE